MNKRIMPLALIPVAFAFFVSCADSESDNKLTGATAEPNAVAQESSDSKTVESSESVHMEEPSSASEETIGSGNGTSGPDLSHEPSSDEMQTLCDSVLAEFANGVIGSQSSGESNLVPASSQAYFNFTTVSNVVYEEGSCRVEIYEDESGVRQVNGEGGLRENVSRYYQKNGVLLQVANGIYQGDGCEQDLEAFRRKCGNDAGVFRDLNGGLGCPAGKLELACVSIVDGSPKGVLQREANLYKRMCEGEIAPKNKECDARCENVGSERVCDTTCRDL